MHEQPVTIPSLGDSYGTFAAAYGTPQRTTALAGCILRRYLCASATLSALFNDGVCIAVHSNEMRLLASGANVAGVTRLLHGRNGWLLATSSCPPHVLAALEGAAGDAVMSTDLVLSAG